jgi:LysR family hca operon transcriptional activator
MPEALQMLRDELPNIDVMISSQYSPQLANALLQGKSRCGGSSTGTRGTGVSVPPSGKEPLVVVLPSDHHLAALKALRPQDLVGETFVTVSDTALHFGGHRRVPEGVRSQYHARS